MKKDGAIVWLSRVARMTLLLVSTAKSCMKHVCWVQLAHYSIQHGKRSGSSHTPKKTSFAYFKNYVSYPSIEVGDTKFKSCIGKEMLFSVVKHVQKLTRNLNSLGLLHEERS